MKKQREDKNCRMTTFFKKEVKLNAAMDFIR